MKCSVTIAAVSNTPPDHSVISLAVLEAPFSVWTAGEHGEIMKWAVSSKIDPSRAPRNVTPQDSSHGEQTLVPVSLLHPPPGPIHFLHPCTAHMHPEDTWQVRHEPWESPEPYPPATTSGRSAPLTDHLLSCHANGALCLWDGHSAQCVRSAWLPEASRNPPFSCRSISEGSGLVLVSSCGADVAEGHFRLCVHVVDASTLAVLQTVHQEKLPMGSIWSIGLAGQRQEDSVLLTISDWTAGRHLHWTGTLTFGQRNQNGYRANSVTWMFSGSNEFDTTDAFGKPFDTTDLCQVAVSQDASAQLAILRTGWLSRQPAKGQMSFADASSAESELAGGSFLETSDGQPWAVLTWQTNGQSEVSSLGGENVTAVLTEASRDPDSCRGQRRVSFFQSGSFLAAAESWPSILRDGVGADPTVKIWRVPDGAGDPAPFRLIGHGQLVASWQGEEAHRDAGSFQESDDFEMVTASCVAQVPHQHRPGLVLVSGTAGGWIQAVPLVGACLRDRKTKGHHGPVLCLVEHSWQGPEGGDRGLNPGPRSRQLAWQQKQQAVVVSGGADWTVRVWGLTWTGDEVDVLGLAVLRCHVSKVTHIVVPPAGALPPWTSTFLSCSEDGGVALVSLETLQVEKMLPGVPGQAGVQVLFDGVRGRAACLGKFQEASSAPLLQIWDLHSGALERVIQAGAATSTFQQLASPAVSTPSPTQTPALNPSSNSGNPNRGAMMRSLAIRGSSLTAGTWTLTFDLRALLALAADPAPAPAPNLSPTPSLALNPGFKAMGDRGEGEESVGVQFCQAVISYLHMWGREPGLDARLAGMGTVGRPPGSLRVGAMVPGEGGCATLHVHRQLDVYDHHFCSPAGAAVRSLLVVALADRLAEWLADRLDDRLENRQAGAEAQVWCQLSEFYLRQLYEQELEKPWALTPPSLEVLACFWQDRNPTVRSAARNLFHANAVRSFPEPLRAGAGRQALGSTPRGSTPQQVDWGAWEPSEVRDWLESRQGWDWVDRMGGQWEDARCARVITGAMLAVRYPSLGRSDLAPGVAPALVGMVRGAEGRQAAAAAEVLAEGMASTWQQLVGPGVPRLIADVFTLCERLGGEPGRQVLSASASSAVREALVGQLLPALAASNIAAFIAVCQGQLAASPWSSPVHEISLSCLRHCAHHHPRALVAHLNQIVQFLLQFLDSSRGPLRNACMQSAMATIHQLSVHFPMVAQHRTASSHQLAVGEALIDTAHLAVHVYDLKSVSKVKVLDASGPPGHPGFMSASPQSPSGRLPSALGSLGGISAMAFSANGESLVAFCQHGTTLRWWTLGSQWWQKLNRGPQLVQCSKMVLVPLSSLSGSFLEADSEVEVNQKEALLRLDFGFKLDWRVEHGVALFHNGVQLAEF